MTYQLHTQPDYATAVITLDTDFRRWHSLPQISQRMCHQHRCDRCIIDASHITDYLDLIDLLVALTHSVVLSGETKWSVVVGREQIAKIYRESLRPERYGGPKIGVFTSIEQALRVGQSSDKRTQYNQQTTGHLRYAG